ncbi:MAG: hydantoinase/oxoprolinase family protein [Gammaproteobacteria bacterium]|nr:hydantoinase/oxoprolinase family protein [Gammaproteobacteria bacterium]MDG2338568.1 hydantoinase/oxoprolinase family protein [Gammaproteobacteria bacterium]
MNLTQHMLLGIDAGGTFTDFVLVRPEPVVSVEVYKTLSTPDAPEQAILHGIRAMGLESHLDDGSLQLIHGSTVATNAVLEVKLARTAFITNYGFADMLELARQTRPQLYALETPAVAPPVPSELCLETGGRIGADGSVVLPLSDAEIAILLKEIEALAPDAIAINLLFSFLDDGFERKIEAAIQTQAADRFVSRSSSVLPEYKEYERGIATWLNAALGPVISGYLKALQEELGSTPLQVMQSSGETMAAKTAAESAVNLLLSGPAGGLTAIAFLAQQQGKTKFISFDMGGTSTDVALLDGKIRTSNESSIASYPIAVPMVDLETIGAGGGSIAFVDTGGMLQVGPRSAGADPGPACYDRGGKEATVSDANLVLGRLQFDAALAGDLKLSLQKARVSIEPLAKRIGLSIEETALGIIDIANEHMAKAIRLISVNKGHDPKQFILASFGGAGSLHVCALADAMGMRDAIVPVHGGVLSALGMVVAEQGRQFSKTLSLDAEQIDEQELEQQYASLEQRGIAQLASEGLPESMLVSNRSTDLRYKGQSYTLNVDFTAIAEAVTAFQELHRQRYGYSHDAPVELLTIRVNVSTRKARFVMPEHIADTGCNNIQQCKVYGETVKAKLLQRTQLCPGDWVEGPAIITEYSATTFLAAGWSAAPDEFGNLILKKLD